MLTVCSLPPEIQFLILNYCDFPSLLKLRQVSSYYKSFVEHKLRSRHRFYISTDYFAIFGGYESFLASTNADDDCDVVFDKIIAFLERYMPDLQDLSLRECNVALTLTGLIQLAAAVPNLNRLDLSQVCGKPYFEKNAVLALPYFRKLKILVMDGFVARKTAGRGCSHWLEVPPLRHMEHLEALELDCPYESLSRILHSLRESRCILYNLKRVNFGVKHCSVVYSELLIWFLRAHRALRSVRICNALFATTDQLRRFYNALISLPDLSELHLENCTLCDQVESSIQAQFIRSITSRGIRHSGTVRSMRYDPDNTLQ